MIANDEVERVGGGGWGGMVELTMRLWLLSEMNSRLLRTSTSSLPGNFRGDVNNRGSVSFSNFKGIGVLSNIFFPP